MAAASSSSRGPSVAPLRSRNVALFEVLAARADVPSSFGFPDDDGIAVEFGILLNDDRVGAVRHRRAGEDPHRLALLDLAGEPGPGSRLPDQLQCGRKPRYVLASHGETVHG